MRSCNKFLKNVLTPGARSARKSASHLSPLSLLGDLGYLSWSA
jgi:hypothetical protein